MAKFERTITGDFDDVLDRLHQGVLEGSSSAITSGGSQAVLFKVNTWGEEAFLDTLRAVADGL